MAALRVSTAMRRRGLVVVVGALALLVGVGGAASLLGYRHALGGLGVVDATPDQLAEAMRADRFYSDYNQDAVVVSGVVASLDGAGSTTLQFRTSGPFTTRCRLDRSPQGVRPGDRVTVVAQGATAERLPSAVLLTGCLVVGG